MKLKLFFAGLMSAASLAAAESCLGGGSKVSTSEVQKALSGILGNAKVVSVSNAPISGLYEVVIESGGRKVPIYIDCNLKYLVNGEIIDINKKVSLTRERLQQLQSQANSEKEEKLVKILGKDKVEMLKKEGLLEAVNIVDLKSIPKSNVAYGNGNIKIYVITDPQCPYCAKLHEEIKKVLAQRKDVSFEMIMYPLPFHKHASGIAQNIICQNDNAAKQKILDAAFSYTAKGDENGLTSLEKPCNAGKQAIDNNLKYGQANGSGALPADKLNKLIDILK